MQHVPMRRRPRTVHKHNMPAYVCTKPCITHPHILSTADVSVVFCRTDKAEEGMVNRDETGREIRSGELVLLQNGEVGDHVLRHVT